MAQKQGTGKVADDRLVTVVKMDYIDICIRLCKRVETRDGGPSKSLASLDKFDGEVQIRRSLSTAAAIRNVVWGVSTVWHRHITGEWGDIDVRDTFAVGRLRFKLVLTRRELPGDYAVNWNERTMTVSQKDLKKAVEAAARATGRIWLTWRNQVAKRELDAVESPPTEDLTPSEVAEFEGDFVAAAAKIMAQE